MNKEEQLLLGLGALMHDIGKMKVPIEILNKPGKLTDAEFEVMKKHVIYSVEILEKMPDFPTQAIEMVVQHHERFNGKGYPLGLKGQQISLFGKIAEIVDVYDAITSDRVYHRAMTPHEAIKLIYESSSTDFEQPLVEKFIKIIGIYPIGSLVEINHFDVGMVISINPENALRPTVLLLFDDQKEKYIPPKQIDLMDKDPSTGKALWSITKVFDPIDREKLVDL